MTKDRKYRYLGRNGILDTKVLLDGINHINIVTISADEGKILSNGERTLYTITVEESEEHKWREITDNTKK